MTPMPPAVVRRARSDEAGAVARLVSEADLPTLGLDQAWAVLVAEDPAGPAGVAAVERYDEGGAPVFLLRSVAVRADRRGVGVGAALVQAALAAADECAGPPARVALLTDTAAGYYPRFGFRPVRRDELPGALLGSPELAGLCPAGAQAFLRG